MAFRKLNHVKSLITGSIESETGSEYLFGYRAETGLQWLERTGVEYSPADPEWRQAEAFVQASIVGEPVGQPRTPQVSVSAVQQDWDESMEAATVQMGVAEPASRPKTVTRSVAGDYDMGAIVNGEVVGSRGGTKDFSEDDIAAQASAYLQELD